VPFPEVDRVTYSKNPLDRVICQFRFPSILKIDKEPPSEFQEVITGDYPNLKDTTLLQQIEFSRVFPEAEQPDIAREVLPSPPARNYQFASENGAWSVNLTRSFLALTATEYTNREDFRERLALPFTALLDKYTIPHFTRIGLRYIDTIDRSLLGLEDTDWTELLQPFLLGPLATPSIGPFVDSVESAFEINLCDRPAKVKLVIRSLKPTEDDQLSYMIDTDFFTTEKTPTNEAIERLEYLAERGSRLFRWCIKDKLHDAMEPMPL
jgi:uncharacterized protein (TIGR04255 family)